MSRRLDIGMASYGTNHARLRQVVATLQRNSVTDWRLMIIHNPSNGDEQTREAICGMAAHDERIVPIWLPENRGYAGAINELFRAATTEYIAYLDNDAFVDTPSWDEKLCGYLDRFHEIGWIFPNGGAYPINRGAYTEIMWGVGFCWVLNRLCMVETGPFDDQIGHQNECDYALRVRMAGWKCAAATDVSVRHEATATHDPAAIERINRGVREFVDKWCRYFGGKNLNYHSPNVLRWEDWHPNALYLEEWWKQTPSLVNNDNPESFTCNGSEYDLIRVPRFKNFYRGRVI